MTAHLDDTSTLLARVRLLFAKQEEHSPFPSMMETTQLLSLFSTPELELAVRGLPVAVEGRPVPLLLVPVYGLDWPVRGRAVEGREDDMIRSQDRLGAGQGENNLRQGSEWTWRGKEREVSSVICRSRLADTLHAPDILLVLAY
jgi:hypothetical protein